MKTIKGAGFTFHLGDEFAIFEPDDGVDDLTRQLLAESMAALKAEYQKPFGLIFPRTTRLAIDLLAAHDLMERNLTNLVAVANVTTDPTTAMSVEYEKTILDQIPIETFSDMNGAIGWITELVREKRREREGAASSDQEKATSGLSP